MTPRTPGNAVMMVLESVFPSTGGGGAEMQVRTLGRHLCQQGIGVSLIVPMVPWGPQLQRDNVDGIEVHRIDYPHAPLMGTVCILAQLVWLLWRERRHYSAIHAHIAGPMAAVSSVMGWLLGKPVIVKLSGAAAGSGGAVVSGRADLKTRLTKAALKCASYYQAISSRIASLLVESGFEAAKVSCIPNGVDTARFTAVQRDEARRREICGDAALVGVFIGRLEPVKGLMPLVEAWARVFGERRDAALVVVGEGGEGERLEARCRELGIASQVKFIGPDDDVARYLGIADFGLLPSLSEGLSNTLLETMAAGLPMLGSRVSGTEDFVRHGVNGWLFEPGDAAGLEAALRAAAATPAAAMRRMGLEGRRTVLARASIAAVAAQLSELYGVTAQDPLPLHSPSSTGG
ncbi:glycosyltransferase [Caldimonas tepidiphila]|uniref:glycosyltransferase n=1 Tax=Caldimonas tepidiphila TaxID=2315841 RepID=UPI0014759CA3|nr:glycosyltransferase [Caldimonas tepidiphila]